MYRQCSSKCKAFCIKIKPYHPFYEAHEEIPFAPLRRDSRGGAVCACVSDMG